MAQVNVTTRVDGLQDIRHRLSMLSKVPQNTLDTIGRQQVETIRTRITQTKVGPDGQAWAPWSQATLKQRFRSGGSLLYRTGALARSISYRVSEKTLTVYSNVGYARYLQQGTYKMPARPFMGWSQPGLNNVRQTMRAALNNVNN